MPRKPYEEVERERRTAILARKPLAPAGACHYCGFGVPKGALWCATDCAKCYEEEKQSLMGGK